MSKKEDFFSKLNIKDYNNKLEDVLEIKSFSEGAKNILLNILYKIENAYDDYKKVKVETKTKREFLEETIDIIRKNCNNIELIKPKLNEETKLKDKKFISELKNQKVISYPNEKNVFYGLCNLQDEKFIINQKYEFLKEPMQKLLNTGYIIDREEILRDFDGWAWNIVKEDIENFNYNIVYQNIKILLGNKFIEEYISNNVSNDFIDMYERKLKHIINEELTDKIYNATCKIAILEHIKNDKQKQEKQEQLKEKLQNELDKIENKKIYLQELANAKKIIGKEIKQIDEIINNSQKLREEFIKTNQQLKEEEKIFSLSEYSEILQNNRIDLLVQLKHYSTIMKPMNYVKTKIELRKKVELLNNLDMKSNFETQLSKLIIELQRDFLEGFKEKIRRIETKKEILEYIYLFRYYKLLPINNQIQIRDIEELQKDIINTEKYLITRACNLKAINILCHNIEKNYKMIAQLLNSNIIDLEEMNLEFKKKDNNIIINIYDDNMIEGTLEYENNEELNVKFNKKIKLFN